MPRGSGEEARHGATLNAQSWRAASRILVQIEALPDFPLFPLGSSPCPTELVPLHIFEERFKALVARCERTEPATEFGIVCAATTTA